MAASSLLFPDRERAELADLFEALGPDAPTRCEGWTTAHLAAHLVVRDSRPDALPGLGVELVGGRGPLPRWTHGIEDRLRTATPYATVVERVRSGPPVWSPFAWPLVTRPFNTAELAVHHEDVRRAQPDWSPRALPREAQDALWKATTLFARGVRGGVVLRRNDVPGTEQRIGGGRRTLTGEPMELLLWVSGRRDIARVTVS